MFGLKVRLILSLCIEVPVPSQWSCNCICVLGYPFASFYDFDIWFWNCSDCGIFCLSVYCSRMKIVYRGLLNNIPVRFGSNWHYSFRGYYYFCIMANKNMNNLFHYCFWGFFFLLLVFCFVLFFFLKTNMEYLYKTFKTSFLKSLVLTAQVVSEERIERWRVYRRRTSSDDKHKVLWFMYN